MTKLLVLEINEINFDLVEKYIADGYLPNFKVFLGKHGYTRTHSESDQGVLNPWVQWITAHTGLNYDDHKIRRLGDMQDKPFEQIWERIEKRGNKVGAFVAFNARNNLKDPAFFLGDPWSREKPVLPMSAKWADDALRQITHDFANGRIAISSVLKLVGSAAVNMQWKNLGRYLRYTKGYLSRKFYRALVCDILMADVFLRTYKRTQPDFATCFVNAGAHVQHHYMFSSKFYDGEIKNPAWYYKPGVDPLKEVYELYDTILGDVLNTVDKGTRIILMTGLSQDPHDRLSIYYRLNDHQNHLDELGVPYTDIQPLMTEDFIVKFKDKEAAAIGQALFEGVHTKLDKDIFYTTTADDNSRENTRSSSVYYVDNRGDSLYVQLKPSNEKYPDNLTLYHGQNGATKKIDNFEKQVSFVSIKNAGHNEMGYLSDSGYLKNELPESVSLNAVPDHIAAIFGKASPMLAI